MAMASKAPNLKDTQQVQVSNHALEKLRERLPPGSHYTSMPDQDLRLRLEEAWKDARRNGRVEEWWEKVEDKPICNFVVDLKDSFDAELVALFREHSTVPGKPATVTVLTKAMADNNKTTNQWARSPDKIGSHELRHDGMARGLASVVIPAATATTVAPRVEVPAVAPARPTTVLEHLRKMVVTYAHPMTGDSIFEFTSKEEIQELVNQLVAQGVDETTIQFWVKAEAKMKKTITVDF